MVDLLGREIAAGEHASQSDSLSDGVLKDRFAVSRSSIREALVILTSKGMIERRKHRGTAVRPIRHWNLLDPDVLGWLAGEETGLGVAEEILEIRLMVEPFAARAAAFKSTRSDLLAIERAIYRLKRSGIGDADRRLAIVDIHRTVLRASGNRLIERLIDVVNMHLGRRSPDPAARTEELRAALQSYDELFEAIAAGDGERASITMTQIVRNGGERPA
ncbi:FadR/GntR family transcriptional regulator [Sphingomonas kyungheensis]|uniref:FCD domain-containing protein n=1 Tax=Sphingomonas kyungheensis TaxID=1069987 RepID=A0ABU8H7I7_9SPHN